MYIEKQVSVGNLVLGSGKPKICVPVMGDTIENIKASLMEVIEKKEFVDIIELRIDYYNEVTDKNSLFELLKELKDIREDIPLLFTFRSAHEGGEMELSKEEYVVVVDNAIESGMVDAVDVELSLGEEYFANLIRLAKANGVKVIASNHDFDKTPDTTEIYNRLKKMDELNADIAKIAVMPKDRQDVLRLLQALTRADDDLKCPVIGISMGKLGEVSRVLGETFGSCLTFGAVNKTSAPGQMDVEKLREFLNLFSV